MLSKDQAKAIIEAHEISMVFDYPEESELLREANPRLADAYLSLMKIAGLAIKHE